MKKLVTTWFLYRKLIFYQKFLRPSKNYFSDTWIFAQIKQPKINFWLISQKLSTIEHMLLHNTNINMTVVHILLFLNHLYDLHRPRCWIPTNISKYPTRFQKNQNISICKGLSTFITSFAFQNVTIAVILKPMLNSYPQKEPELRFKGVAIPDAQFWLAL